MPAEWQAHEATWLAWPIPTPFWRNSFSQLENTWLTMVQALHRVERVSILVQDHVQEEHVKKLLTSHSVALSSIQFYPLKTIEPWIRDYGPIFVKRQSDSKSVIIDWKFNAWGGKYPGLCVNDFIPEKIAHLVDVVSISEDTILEGGALDVNGCGEALVTEECVLNPNRNLHMRREDIEKKLHDRLGIVKTHWLKGGLEGDDTDGHIDNVARFINETTIVYAQEKNQEAVNFKMLSDNEERLKKIKNLKGKAFQLVPIPLPRKSSINQKGLPMSYVNFYIANGVVLVPTFGDDNDKEALRILKPCFPNRSVIAIDSQVLIEGKGAIHCVTQQQPR
jgi:agmatine deiminase